MSTNEYVTGKPIKLFMVLDELYSEGFKPPKRNMKRVQICCHDFCSHDWKELCYSLGISSHCSEIIFDIDENSIHTE